MAGQIASSRGFVRPRKLLSSVAAFLVLSACRHTAAPPAPAPLVVAAPVQAAADDVVGRSLRYPGEVAPRYSTQMSFRVGGLIVERNVRLGEQVHRGQVLARLDAADAERAVQAARAALEAAAHRLQFAHQQLERDQAQYDRGLIAATQLEQTQDAFASASAARQQALDNLVLAENALKYHALVAEHDGLIASELADTGQVVSAGQGVYALAWSGDVDVIVDVAARDVGRVVPGDPAQVRLAALDGSLTAHVREAAPVADPTTRTYRVRLQLDAPSPAVRLGMTGTVSLIPSHEPAIDPFVVPATSIFHSGTHPAVWVIRADSTLELRSVEVLRYRERVALVSGALEAGERVVAAGVHTVHAGERIQPVPALFSAQISDEEGGAPVAQTAPTASAPLMTGTQKVPSTGGGR
jgi:RND family efflux transporter MFP subunit